jgi:hypothetical protein
MKVGGDRTCGSNGFITAALLGLARGNTATVLYVGLNNLKSGNIRISHSADIGPCILWFMVTLSLYFILEYRIVLNKPV